MPAPISIVIPTLNAADVLPATLASLMPALLNGLVQELIITDGGSTDQTLEIAEEVGARVVSGPAGRGGQLRRGVEEATAPWILVLHADTHLSGDWTRALSQHMDAGGDRAGFFTLQFRAVGIAPAWVAGWANWRSRVLGMPYGDQGLFIARRLYDQMGGYDDIPLMEDVALVRRLKRRLAPLDGLAITSAARYERDGWMRRGAKNLWTLARYRMGVSPERLARSYSKR